MSTKRRQLFNGFLLIAAGVVTSACATVGGSDSLAPLIIQEQGSFAVGGTVITNPGTYDPTKQQAAEGQTFHGDHAYVFYQIPVNARRFPLVLWHGFGQFSKTWETTPDGREGFQNIFLRRGFWRLRDRPATTRQCRTQHPASHDHADARRADLVQHFPRRYLAELFPRRAVLARPGGAEPVLPRR